MNNETSDLPAADVAGRTRVRVRTLVLIRWLAIIGQLVTLLTISDLLGGDIPMPLALGAVACSAVLNLAIGIRRGLNGWHNEIEAALFLAFDILQLAVLLFLTGGLENPFAILVLAPVTISATILRLYSTLALGGLAFICTSFLTVYHLPLPWPFGDFKLPEYYPQAIWLGLAVCMTFLVFYAWRVARESRRMSDALTATRLALMREQELSALGGLAANAAHALGTPLGTIALVVKELRRNDGAETDISDDLALLQEQIDRCRDILTELSNPDYPEEDPRLNRQTMAVLALSVAEPYLNDGVAFHTTEVPHGSEDPAPLVRRSPELLKGISNLLENAVDFARSRVEIESDWNAGEVKLTIRDNGPGFSNDIFAMLGDPYVSSRRHRGGMGLGVFISKTLLERTGASLRFANQRGGNGAEVTIVWPRIEIEVR